MKGISCVQLVQIFNNVLFCLGRMSADGLSRYLMSDENLCVKSEVFEVHQDMNQPLSHYFINSSHNTYLTGKRLHYAFLCGLVIFENENEQAIKKCKN